MNAGREREALRQQMMLRALWRDASSGVLRGWLRDADPARGIAAYRANGGAVAERALAAAFPTVAQLVGGESFAALARAFWHAEPPERGDLAGFGAGLPAFIAASAQLADEPYLADCARLDWALHRAELAADGDAPHGIERLASDDPARLVLRLAPGAALVESTHPIVSIRRAHESEAQDRFDRVRDAFAAGRGENAFVWRDGWRGRYDAVAGPDAAFMRAVLDGRTLAGALESAGEPFDFEPWLLRALRERWLDGVERLG